MRPVRRLTVLGLAVATALGLGLTSQPSAPNQQAEPTPTPTAQYHPDLRLRAPASLRPREEAYLLLSYNHAGETPVTLSVALPAWLAATGVDPSQGSCQLGQIVACEASPGDGMAVTVVVFVRAAAELCGGWQELEASAETGGTVVRSTALMRLDGPVCATPTPTATTLPTLTPVPLRAVYLPLIRR